MTAFRTLDQADVKGKRVLVRVDLNVPMENGRVTDATRIERVAAHHPGDRRRAARSSCSPISAARRDATRRSSLKPVAEAARRASRQAGRPSPRTASARPPQKAVAALKDGEVLLPREHPLPRRARRRTTRPSSRSWRSSATSMSTTPSRPPTARMPRRRGSPACCPAYAGRTMQAELEALSKGLEAPERPLVAIVGGAKVSTKLDLLEQPRHQGRRPRHRRRHGQHLPPCHGRRRSASRSPSRTSPTTARAIIEKARDAELCHHPAGRRRRRLRVQGRRAEPRLRHRRDPRRPA